MAVWNVGFLALVSGWRSLPNHEEHRPFKHKVLAMTRTTQSVQQSLDG